jgi:hypothetical protein
MKTLPQEVDIELGGIELTVFYDVSPLSGIDIHFIYHQNVEISHYLNYLAIADIKQAIFGKMDKNL